MGLARANFLRLGAAGADLADAIYPRRCFLCGAFAPGGLGCEEHAWPPAGAVARCGRCAAPLPRGVPAGMRCAACVTDPPSFSRTVCVSDYRVSSVREWLLAFKHGGRADLARPLGALLAQALDEAGIRASGSESLALVPVPLHPLRRLERGYDQARLLARALAQLGDGRVIRALARTRSTPPQGAPGAVSRRANVRGAFRPAWRGARAVRGRAVVLVDDVVTSGATAHECALVLKRLGALEVAVACLARAASEPGSARL